MCEWLIEDTGENVVAVRRNDQGKVVEVGPLYELDDSLPPAKDCLFSPEDKTDPSLPAQRLEEFMTHEHEYRPYVA